MAPVEAWPDYLIERARQAPPEHCRVVAGTTPVVSFGDPVRPAVATLGINPSKAEFLDDHGGLLAGPQRRLATLASLGVSGYGDVDAAQGSAIVDECAGYFRKRPYRWFRPLDQILRDGADVSYFDGTACHLDLVQWATCPLWSELDDSIRARLLEADKEFLVRQLQQECYRLIVVNGRTVMDWVERAGLASWKKVGQLRGPPSVDLCVSAADGPRFVGWSCNLQSQPGAPRHAAALAQFVREHAVGVSVAPVTISEDHIPKGTRLGSINELVETLQGWLESSNADRLGTAGSYGGRPWLTVETPLGRMNLNADTRRDAIDSFVSVARRGPALRMNVSANQHGLVNKVTFEGCQDEGWYAYLRQALTTPVSGFTTGEASIVQFPHPGGEHVPRTDVMPWNIEPHRRKFLKNPGSVATDDGAVTFAGPLAFWGEWEPPSTIEQRWKRKRGLPTVLHAPYWDDPGPSGWRENTDPWVFGPQFLYSNCKQLNPSGTPSALQRLQVGSMILFGSARDGEFVLDTVFVVADIIAHYRPVEELTSGSKGFDVCTVASLQNECDRIRKATFTLFRGATPRQPVNGMFSFVPCSRWIGDGSRFARPFVRLPGIINPLSYQSPSGAKILRSQAEVVAAWRNVVAQVTTADLELGVDLAEPPRRL
jgi:hypothetical protein